jgi:hypothetical protein
MLKDEIKRKKNQLENGKKNSSQLSQFVKLTIWVMRLG